MKYTKILKIADFVVLYLKEIGIEVSPMKLQKLLYYIQGWHLAYFGHSFFVDAPEAWVNGPVYKRVYDKYKNLYRNSDIPSKYIFEETSSEIIEELELEKKQKELLFEILRVYGNKSDITLVNKTHSEAPWLTARKGLGPFEPSNNDISHYAMKKYFKSKL